MIGVILDPTKPPSLYPFTLAFILAERSSNKGSILGLTPVLDTTLVSSLRFVIDEINMSGFVCPIRYPIVPARDFATSSLTLMLKPCPDLIPLAFLSSSIALSSFSSVAFCASLLIRIGSNIFCDIPVVEFITSSMVTFSNPFSLCISPSS